MRADFRVRAIIAAITVNRWSHGFAYTANSLFDGDDAEQIAALARRPSERVAIANSDAGWDAYAHTAIDQDRMGVSGCGVHGFRIAAIGSPGM